MCSANPAYTENLDIFNRWIGGLGLPVTPKSVTLGLAPETMYLRWRLDSPNQASFTSIAIQ